MSAAATLTPMLPIFVEQHDTPAVTLAATDEPSLDEDRAYLREYLANWGNSFGSESRGAGDFAAFARTAARVSAAAGVAA